MDYIMDSMSSGSKVKNIKNIILFVDYLILLIYKSV